MTVRTAHIRKMLDWAHQLAEQVDGMAITDSVHVPAAMRGGPDDAEDMIATVPQALAFAADMCLHAAAELRMEYAAKHGWSQP